MSNTHKVVSESFKAVWRVGALDTTSYLTARAIAKADSMHGRTELKVNRNLSGIWKVKEVWEHGLMTNYVAGV
jgi:hypothetical protein